MEGFYFFAVYSVLCVSSARQEYPGKARGTKHVARGKKLLTAVNFYVTMRKSLCYVNSMNKNSNCNIKFKASRKRCEPGNKMCSEWTCEKSGEPSGIMIGVLAKTGGYPL